MKYRKKPVIIEASQWDGSYKGMNDLKAKFPKMVTLASSIHANQGRVMYWKIGTLEGGHEVSPMDFVIEGVKGEYYPCKPDIFEMTYEKVEEPKQ